MDLDFEAEGFSLHVKSAELKKREREKIIDVMGRAAKKVQTEVRV